MKPKINLVHFYKNYQAKFGTEKTILLAKKDKIVIQKRMKYLPNDGIQQMFGTSDLSIINQYLNKNQLNMKTAVKKPTKVKAVPTATEFNKLIVSLKAAPKKDISSLKKRFDFWKKSSGLGNSLPKGMTKVIAKNIKIQGLSKTTGKILKGYKYAKGGKIVKVKAVILKKKIT